MSDLCRVKAVLLYTMTRIQHSLGRQAKRRHHQLHHSTRHKQRGLAESRPAETWPVIGPKMCSPATPETGVEASPGASRLGQGGDKQGSGRLAGFPTRQHGLHSIPLCGLLVSTDSHEICKVNRVIASRRPQAPTVQVKWSHHLPPGTGAVDEDARPALAPLRHGDTYHPPPPRAAGPGSARAHNERAGGRPASWTWGAVAAEAGS